MENFRDLHVWRKAHELTLVAYTQPPGVRKWRYMELRVKFGDGLPRLQRDSFCRSYESIVQVAVFRQLAEHRSPPAFAGRSLRPAAQSMLFFTYVAAKSNLHRLFRAF